MEFNDYEMELLHTILTDAESMFGSDLDENEIELIRKVEDYFAEGD